MNVRFVHPVEIVLRNVCQSLRTDMIIIGRKYKTRWSLVEENKRRMLHDS